MSPKFSMDGQWLFVPYGTNRDRLSLHRVPVTGGKLEPVQFPGIGADIDRVESIEMAAPTYTDSDCCAAKTDECTRLFYGQR